MATGFTVYDIETNAPVTSITHDIGQNYCIPVIFAHRGNALIGGSPSGTVGLWDAKSGNLLHRLQHKGESFTACA